MLRQLWVYDDRKTLVCVDSYDGGVMEGRFFSPRRGMERFSSLSQFLVRMESLLEESRVPQAYTSARSFSALLPQERAEVLPVDRRHGAKATFELQILFRQHSSWQGLVVWKDKKVEQSFRSVLELVLLMDSALRGMDGYETMKMPTADKRHPKERKENISGSTKM